MAYIDDTIVSRHRSLVLGCLREEDPSIRRRALELLIALVRLNTVEIIVSELLQYLVGVQGRFDAERSRGQRRAKRRHLQSHFARAAVRSVGHLAGRYAAGVAEAQRRHGE